FGITMVAGIPGGANLPLYHALAASSITHILTRHEQGAGFIAQGIARITGKAAVCLATSGPGATNILTAVADAKLDSVPMVVITGQVPTGYLGTDAFQEVDLYGMTIPVTKHNFLVRSPEELLSIIPEAFDIAEEGRPGPVVIDVPKDVQKGVVEVDVWPERKKKAGMPPANERKLQEAAVMIEQSRRPLIYFGGGIIAAGAAEELRVFAGKNSIPAVGTLMGLGVFPHSHPLYLGMIGMHGDRATNLLTERTDLLLAFGVRFDDRATGDVSRFCSGAKVVHIDIDASEINKNRESHLSITGEIKEALRRLMSMVSVDTRSEWLDEIEKTQAAFPRLSASGSDMSVPENLIREIGRYAPDDAIIVTDVGQHQMWTAQYYPFKSPRTFLTSGGLGTMGFGLPAAIGAALASPGKRIICISGDGSILMNLQEFATLADLGLDVTVFILDNGHLGLVRQQQEYFYDKVYMASKFATRPDFVKAAESFGLASMDLGESNNPGQLIRNVLSNSGAFIVRAPILEKANVVPMVPPGAANFEMIGG
ncbi:MAG: biosynthetic-type acetolactate synthase large subunit, partial [Spirochaetales bacterium]|nr:biosynthetic-type acetolactate synthase large subunit [Spirochaetales bacterium]